MGIELTADAPVDSVDASSAIKSKPKPFKAETRAKFEAVALVNAESDFVVESGDGVEIGSLHETKFGELEILARKDDGFVLVATEENGVPCFFSVHKDDLT